MNNDILFDAHHFAHHASTLFIRAHSHRDNSVTRDHYTRMALEQFKAMADALGYELVKRNDNREAA